MQELADSAGAALHALRFEGAHARHVAWALAAIRGVLEPQAILQGCEPSGNVRRAVEYLTELAQALMSASYPLRVLLEPEIVSTVTSCIDNLLVADLAEPALSSFAAMTGNPPVPLPLSEEGSAVIQVLQNNWQVPAADKLANACGCDCGTLLRVLEEEEPQSRFVELLGDNARIRIKDALSLLEEHAYGADNVDQAPVPENDDQIPERFRCRITDERMVDPVVIAESEQGPFDRKNIQEWFRRCHERGEAPRCPMTNQCLVSTHLVSLHHLRQEIEQSPSRKGRNERGIRRRAASRQRGYGGSTRQQQAQQHQRNSLLFKLTLWTLNSLRILIGVLLMCGFCRFPGHLILTFLLYKLKRKLRPPLHIFFTICVLYTCVRFPRHMIPLVLTLMIHGFIHDNFNRMRETAE